MLPNALFPEAVVQSYLNASSDLLTIDVLGIEACKETLLFDKLQVPFSPFEKDKDTGTLASFTIVAQDVKIKVKAKINIFFILKIEHFKKISSTKNL